MSQSMSNTIFGYSSSKEVNSRIKNMNHQRKLSSTSSNNLYYKTTNESGKLVMLTFDRIEAEEGQVEEDSVYTDQEEC